MLKIRKLYYRHVCFFYVEFIVNMLCVCLISDVDECNSTQSTCSASANCVNTDGSFTCACNEGFRQVVLANGLTDCRGT